MISDSGAPELTAEARESDRGFLWDFWYPALRSEQVQSRELTAAMLLGIPLVLGRDSGGRAFCLRDSCPHRGMPLSAGLFDGRSVECSYHGWRFEPGSGQCIEIPSRTDQDKLKVERIFAPNFACEERDGYFWVYLPEREKRSIGSPREQPVLPCPEMRLFGGPYRMTHLWAGLPCHVDHGIIGLMDPAHGPFVHQAWWWRSRRSIHEKQKVFDPIPNGFRMRSHSPSANSAFYKILGVYGQPITTQIDFVLPNMRFEEIHCGPHWFSSRTTVTPVHADLCRIDFCAAWNVFRNVPFLTSIFRFFGKRFIGQDQRTMEKQAVGLKSNPNLMLIDDADRPAKWYFQLKAACQQSRTTGQVIEHPLSGPVTLRWRS